MAPKKQIHEPKMIDVTRLYIPVTAIAMLVAAVFFISQIDSKAEKAIENVVDVDKKVEAVNERVSTQWEVVGPLNNRVATVEGQVSHTKEKIDEMNSKINSIDLQMRQQTNNYAEQSVLMREMSKSIERLDKRNGKSD